PSPSETALLYGSILRGSFLKICQLHRIRNGISTASVSSDCLRSTRATYIRYYKKEQQYYGCRSKHGLGRGLLNFAQTDRDHLHLKLPAAGLLQDLTGPSAPPHQPARQAPGNVSGAEGAPCGSQSHTGSRARSRRGPQPRGVP